MKKIFQYLMLLAAAFAVASCANDIEDTTAVISNDNVKFVVGNFPAFNDPQTRTIGTTDAGKTAWAAGDELLLEIANTSYGTQHATFTYNGKSWELSSGKLVFRDGDLAIMSHVYYAPNYKWVNNTLKLKDGKTDGTDEYIEGMARITNNGTTISVSFPYDRNYSRLRIATMADQDITIDVKGFTPAGNSSSVSTSYAIHSDAKGNAYLYGNFAQNATGIVKYKGATLASHTFTEATVNKKSYALNATAISIENLTLEQIEDTVKKELAKKLALRRTDISFVLAPDADKDVFNRIKNGVATCPYAGAVKLVLIGCKKIPSEGFKEWDPLNSISLPDVTEIEERAFSGCAYLRKIVLGNITKVYGKKDSGDGIFDYCITDLELVLPEDQKNMEEGGVEGTRYYYTPTNESYLNSTYHKARKFLGYEFGDVTCGTTTY